MAVEDVQDIAKQTDQEEVQQATGEQLAAFINIPDIDLTTSAYGLLVELFKYFAVSDTTLVDNKNEGLVSLTGYNAQDNLALYLSMPYPGELILLAYPASYYQSLMVKGWEDNDSLPDELVEFRVCVVEAGLETAVHGDLVQAGSLVPSLDLSRLNSQSAQAATIFIKACELRQGGKYPNGQCFWIPPLENDD